jgi:hypothetical protein
MGSKINRQIAALPGVRDAVKAAARSIERNAKVLAQGHGGLAGDIALAYPNRYDVDVEIRHTAALAIEVGHFTPDGTEWVPGIHVLTDAAAMEKGK